MKDREEYYKIIGRNIAFFRKRKHLTQVGLSMKAMFQERILVISKRKMLTKHRL